MSKPSTKHNEPESVAAQAPPLQAADTSRLTATEAIALQPVQAATPPAPPPVAAPPRHIAPLALPRIVLAHAADGNISNRWTATVPKGTTWEDVKSDWFWANRAKDMKPGDEILVLHDIWEFVGRLLVQQTRVVGPGVVPNRVSVFEESFREGALPAPSTNFDGMYVQYRGVYPKWCVMERGKNEPIREGYDSEMEAQKARHNLAATRTEPRRPDAWHG